MPVIGLTGGIASGKSMVSRILRSLGAHIVDADMIARELVKPGLPAWKEIVEKFGRDILLADNNINRPLLGQIIFQDPEKRKVLNDILHPRILEEAKRQIQELAKKHPRDIIVFDAALLIELGAHQLVDKVILVYIPVEKQVERLMKRDGLTREEALQRINAQMPGEEKKRFADYIIDTSGSEEDVRKQTEKIFSEIRGGK